MQSVGMDALSSSILVTEVEVEESNTEIDEVDYADASEHTGSGDGGHAIIPTSDPLRESPFINKSTSLRPGSKDLLQKSHLFILYCCLKLDC